MQPQAESLPELHHHLQPQWRNGFRGWPERPLCSWMPATPETAIRCSLPRAQLHLLPWSGHQLQLVLVLPLLLTAAVRTRRRRAWQ